jgi:hypothetical protein
MKPALPSFVVTLNQETFELLQEVREGLVSKLGFQPTNGQVVKHLIAFYNGEAE